MNLHVYAWNFGFAAITMFQSTYCPLLVNQVLQRIFRFKSRRNIYYHSWYVQVKATAILGRTFPNPVGKVSG